MLRFLIKVRDKFFFLFVFDYIGYEPFQYQLKLVLFNLSILKRIKKNSEV